MPALGIAVGFLLVCLIAASVDFRRVCARLAEHRRGQEARR